MSTPKRAEKAGLVFTRVQEDAGVYKQTPKGTEAFRQFFGRFFENINGKMDVFKITMDLKGTLY